MTDPRDDRPKNDFIGWVWAWIGVLALFLVIVLIPLSRAINGDGS